MSDTPKTDAALDAGFTYEEKLEEVTDLCRDLERSIRDFAGDIERQSYHPAPLRQLIELADNRTCRHAFNPAFSEPNNQQHINK